jgi:hypothetical protein
MSKFAKLTKNFDQPFKVEIPDPFGDPLVKPVLRDANKNPCYVEIYALDSTKGREFDKLHRGDIAQKVRAGQPVNADSVEFITAKCAALTKSWHIVDPETHEVIDEPCTEENARELYSLPGLSWLFDPVQKGAADPANFMKQPSRPLSGTASTSGGGAES